MMVKNKGGMPTMLRKTDIRVPHDYQRALNRSRSRWIANNFDWFEFDPLKIHRNNGVYEVVDGQHRLHATLDIPEVDLLPCMLYDFEGPQQAAEYFVKAQLHRKPLVVTAVHKAELFAGGEFGAVASRAQLFMDRLSGVILPLQTIRKLWRDLPEAFARIEDLIVEMAPREAIRKDFLEGIVWLEADLGPEESLASKWRERVKMTRYDRCLASMIHYHAKTAQYVSKVASPRQKADALRWALSMRMTPYGSDETSSKFQWLRRPTVLPDFERVEALRKQVDRQLSPKTLHNVQRKIYAIYRPSDTTSEPIAAE